MADSFSVNLIAILVEIIIVVHKHTWQVFELLIRSGGRTQAHFCSQQCRKSSTSKYSELILRNIHVPKTVGPRRSSSQPAKDWRGHLLELQLHQQQIVGEKIQG